VSGGIATLVLGLALNSGAWTAHSRIVETEALPELPVPLSNNAVALVATDRGFGLYSFFGLESGTSWRHLSRRGWVLLRDTGTWRETAPLPGATGRLAAVAVTVGEAVWVFGGYTVAEDGAEVSTPQVYRLDTGSGLGAQVTDMPVPVDDTVATVYRDRYVYLVSGWHDVGNVNLVQVLDTATLEWSQATPYPGQPVFGHAGGMAGNRMLVCDGVRIEYPADGSQRRFLPASECWLGEVDSEDFRRIGWRPVPAHPGAPRYRMAAAADDHGRVVFAGGSANPYNYDGVGYNGQPSEPESTVFSFDLEAATWAPVWEWPDASMDHRGMSYHQGWYYVIGGMANDRQPSRRVLRFRLPAEGD
jgi:N-acetylneuraminic acid mutarotase